MNTNTRPSSGRVDAAAWWINQLTYRLQRYLARPDADMRAALLSVMDQYEGHVLHGQVELPRFLFPTE